MSPWPGRRQPPSRVTASGASLLLGRSGPSCGTCYFAPNICPALPAWLDRQRADVSDFVVKQPLWLSGRGALQHGSTERPSVRPDKGELFAAAVIIHAPVDILFCGLDGGEMARDIATIEYAVAAVAFLLDSESTITHFLYLRFQIARPALLN